MKKEIKNYIHLYLGCQFMCRHEYNTEFIKSDHRLDVWDLKTQKKYEGYEIKPILRSLADATPDEIKEIEDSRVFVKATPVHQVGNMQWTPETFRLALSMHFDLFSLINDGLAINAKELKSVHK